MIQACYIYCALFLLLLNQFHWDHQALDPGGSLPLPRRELLRDSDPGGCGPRSQWKWWSGGWPSLWQPKISLSLKVIGHQQEEKWNTGAAAALILLCQTVTHAGQGPVLYCPLFPRCLTVPLHGRGLVNICWIVDLQSDSSVGGRGGENGRQDGLILVPCRLDLVWAHRPFQGWMHGLVWVQVPWAVTQRMHVKVVIILILITCLILPG